MNRIGEFGDAELTDHKDSVLYMMYRRTINGEYADEPVDFNAAGIYAGEQLLKRAYTPDDILADVGSSSGKSMAEAALGSDLQARVICVEPSEDAFDNHLRLPDKLQERIRYIRAVGEELPLQDDSLTGASLHNVIFRASDPLSVLNELKRTIVPGGYIAISSNGKNHAHYRHRFESEVARKVMEIAGIEIDVPEPPAMGHYLEDLPKLIAKVGQLEIMPELYVTQDTQATITRGARLDVYLNSIKYSAANTDLPIEHRSTWRRVVDFWVKPYIEARIDEAEVANLLIESAAEPCFADPIRRGMFVIRNNK